MNKKYCDYGKDYSYFKVHFDDWKRPSYRLWWFLRTILEVVIPIKLPKGAKILSVGSGLGYAEHFLSRVFGHKVFMVDVSCYAMELNRKLFGKTNYKVAKVTKLPFKDNTFDLVMSYDLMEHLENENEASKALSEMNRVLKKNNGVRMFHKVTVTEDDGINQDPTHGIKWSLNRWQRWFENKGWYTIRSTSHYIPNIFGRKFGLTKVKGTFYLSRQK